MADNFLFYLYKEQIDLLSEIDRHKEIRDFPDQMAHVRHDQKLQGLYRECKRGSKRLSQYMKDTYDRK